jgi:hypothetical protein
MALTTDLVTLEEAKAYLEYPTTNERKDDMLEGVIAGASLGLENWCRVPLIQREFTEYYTAAPFGSNDGYSSGGANVIWLNKYPVVSVDSIEDGYGNTVIDTDYHIDSRHGTLIHSGGWPTAYDANDLVGEWTIVYTAGHFASTSVVTSDVKLACNMMIASYVAMKSGMVQRMHTGDLKVWFHDQDMNNLPPLVRQIMNRYKGNRI